METDVLVAVITVAASLVVAIVTSWATTRREERRLRAELRTEFMAEEAVRALLSDDRWRQRSFEQIRRRIGGFDDDELRRTLVRAGAVRFTGAEGLELWGLRSRNAEALGPDDGA